MKNKLPTEPGYYWVQENSDSCDDWEIASVEGEAPFFEVYITGTTQYHKCSSPKDQLIWGPKIEEPEI